MPEAYALRKFYWQLFVTLTFIRPPRSRPASLPPVRRWLRVVARMASVHFERLIWVVRFEVGKRGDCGHYHLCLAGIPRALLCIHFCRELESAWRTCGGGLSQVALYDQARDGLEYILKLPVAPKGSNPWCTTSSGTGGHDCEPMLSASLLQAVKRGRM